MAYSAKDFGGCMFNPLVDGRMVESYDRLNEILLPEWIDENLDSIVRFIICVYDPRSPLFLTERDLNYRKGVAASICGFDLQDTDLLTSIYNCTHPYFVDLTMRFLMRFIKSKEFAAIVIVENCFWESCQKLMEPITGKATREELDAVQKKSVIKDELDKDILRLDRYYKAFYAEDAELELKAKTKATPEAMAKRLAKL